jgi:hypothetical protein
MTGHGGGNSPFPKKEEIIDSLGAGNVGAPATFREFCPHKLEEMAIRLWATPDEQT